MECDIFLTCLPQAHLGIFQLCLWPLIAPGYLGGGGLPCLSSALWCQYPNTYIQHNSLHNDWTVRINWCCSAEIGDYDPEEHLVDYVSQFRLLPKQTPRHEQRIAELHKTLASVTYLIFLHFDDVINSIFHEVGEWVGYNVPINTLQVISETSLSSQSLALLLTT